ncbi:hypothetical protein J1N51_00745 [Psychrosphaera ytuae]|uniref:Lipoprotein n=1 Tax=Psychrosphaera ytuae TaxID=2820710 RepID=A0A975DBE5_9GAMM|nr:hypothetical protein [Psychrosphaera ytuae]QTH64055.1 hypothetical protein J1N51_00745 [Psychrosphaera ytuae]
MKLFITTLIATTLVGCSTGKLEYINARGETKFACETEYSWQPSVDKYAVEYVLSYCAKQAVKQGHTVVDQRLLALDLSVPEAPKGQIWSFELAKSMHNKDLITDKEYGYLVAYIDLGHNLNDQ